MRTDIDHIPTAKHRELDRVVRILFEEFEEATALATQDWKKKGRILKIILYGSYARGDWVDEPHTAKGYQSDFDLLIIVSDDRLTDRVRYWEKADERLIRELAISKTLRTPVNFIVHSLHEVNDGLAHGRYFFMGLELCFGPPAKFLLSENRCRPAIDRRGTRLPLEPRPLSPEFSELSICWELRSSALRGLWPQRRRCTARVVGPWLLGVAASQFFSPAALANRIRNTASAEFPL